ncbi:ATP-binding cassette domain-containing protein [Zavarzinia compransoris]|uniref:ABC-F family ATP-binding cassette domain-containing protein n=1 Tax=Zavarzinia marina TaxID=2911065 RepID=UPI001F409289|nr:ATP-binding cassette domain-containing protein [Zavarzinia marina]MCF4165102.1 ATP-binding cassette domain-containing protein [Zavarzinia marina]
MAAPLLTLRDIHVGYGGHPVIDGADLIVGPEDRICLVGRNGSGKSTLMKIAAGLVEPDRGKRILQSGTTVRYLPQEPDLSAFPSVLAYVEAGLAPGDDHHRALSLLQSLGMTGDEDPKALSGGEIRRAALARTLAPEPDVLLLDEPTNHMDLPAIEWLEAELKRSRSALVLISHDRTFLTALSRATVWLDRGVARRTERGFGAFEDWRDDVLEQEEKERHKLDRKIVAEEDWVRHGVSGRRKRNMRRLGQLHAMRKDRREERKAVGTVKMTAGEGDVSGKLVIEARDVSKGFDGRAIISHLDLRLRRGDRLGIVGPNGAGKTTLINLLTGALAPDSGDIRLGTNLEMVTLDQKRESLAPTTTLQDALTGGGSDRVEVAGSYKHVIGYMKDFLFGPEQARTPLGVLSGGERGRVMLARALAKQSNLLVLDEPTNDLDLETLDLLEEILADYGGTVLVVSHDRDFLDRVATSVLAYEGPGRWTEYAGGYSDMVAQRGHGVEAREDDTPTAPKAGPNTAEAAPRAAQKRKLSFKEKHALETLPARIEALEAEIADLQARLADADLFARDPGAFQKTADRLAAAEAERARAEEDWLNLELLREELEG